MGVYLLGVEAAMVERHEVAADCAAGFGFRIVLEGVSPLVWRRLLISADTSIARLHEVLQIAFGWDGEHLHRFVIHGRDQSRFGLPQGRRRIH